MDRDFREWTNIPGIISRTINSMNIEIQEMKKHISLFPLDKFAEYDDKIQQTNSLNYKAIKESKRADDKIVRLSNAVLEMQHQMNILASKSYLTQIVQTDLTVAAMEPAEIISDSDWEQSGVESEEFDKKENGQEDRQSNENQIGESQVVRVEAPRRRRKKSSTVVNNGTPRMLSIDMIEKLFKRFYARTGVDSEFRKIFSRLDKLEETQKMLREGLGMLHIDIEPRLFTLSSRLKSFTNQTSGSIKAQGIKLEKLEANQRQSQSASQRLEKYIKQTSGQESAKYDASIQLLRQNISALQEALNQTKDDITKIQPEIDTKAEQSNQRIDQVQLYLQDMDQKIAKVEKNCLRVFSKKSKQNFSAFQQEQQEKLDKISQELTEKLNELAKPLQSKVSYSQEMIELRSIEIKSLVSVLQDEVEEIRRDTLKFTELDIETSNIKEARLYALEQKFKSEEGQRMQLGRFLKDTMKKLMYTMEQLQMDQPSQITDLNQSTKIYMKRINYLKDKLVNSSKQEVNYRQIRRRSAERQSISNKSPISHSPIGLRRDFMSTFS